MPGEFDGKVVMITGASGGLGQAVVQRFYAQGANLALIERQPTPLPENADASHWFSISADVTDQASLANAIEQIVVHYGHIDVLAHTVGGYAAGKAVHEVDLELWDRMMRLNALSVYVTAGTVAAHMIEREINGRIVVVLARQALEGSKNHSAYAASKAAAQRIIQSMSKELVDYGITVNAVVPGTIDTPTNRSAMPNANYDKWVKPEAIADVILFLSSPHSSAISGDSITVYGQS